MTDELRAEFLLDGRIWLYPRLISICDDLIVSVTDWQHTVTMMIPDALVLEFATKILRTCRVTLYTGICILL